MYKQALYGWTDYPFEELGDIPYQKAPVRAIKIDGYDRDKYVSGICGGRRVLLKLGYVYKRPGRVQEILSYSHKAAEALGFLKGLDDA